MKRGILLSVLVLLSCHTFAQEEDSEVRQQAKQKMESLAEQGLKIGMKALVNSGQLYPFAEIMLKNGKTKTLGKKRTAKEVEPAAEWASELFYTVRANVKQEGEIIAAALTRLHEVESEQGDKVRGVWTLVDHRQHRPFVVFLPLIKQENGKHKPGKLVYYATEQWFFEPVKPESE